MNPLKKALSRRRFLEATVAASLVASADAQPVETADADVDATKEALEAIVAKYGSEFGDIREAR